MPFIPTKEALQEAQVNPSWQYVMTMFLHCFPATRRTAKEVYAAYTDWYFQGKGKDESRAKGPDLEYVTEWLKVDFDIEKRYHWALAEIGEDADFKIDCLIREYGGICNPAESDGWDPGASWNRLVDKYECEIGRHFTYRERKELDHQRENVTLWRYIWRLEERLGLRKKEDTDVDT